MLKKHKRYLYIGLIVLMNIIVIILIVKALKNGIKDKKDIIAYVNNRPVYRKEVQTRIDSFLANSNIQEHIALENFPENFLKAIVLEISVSHKLDYLAKKANYHRNKEIRELVDTYQNRLMREKFIQEKIMADINDETIAKRYAELVASLEGKEERKVKHILVKDEEEANRVRRNILRTGNFDRIASEKSLDKSTSEKGGDLGYILKEEMVPEFGDVAFILEKGKLSKPVQTQFGWHIIKVEDIREAKALPFDEVKDDIRNGLQQEALQIYLQDATKDAKVELIVKGASEKTLDNDLDENNEQEQNRGNEESEEMNEEIDEEEEQISEEVEPLSEETEVSESQTN